MRTAVSEQEYTTTRRCPHCATKLGIRYTEAVADGPGVLVRWAHCPCSARWAEYFNLAGYDSLEVGS